MKNELNQYYRAIRRCLPCSCKQKQQIMDRIRQSISSYMEEIPLADFSAVQAHFGTPQQIAHAYIEEMRTEEIAEKFNRKKSIATIVSVAVGLSFLMWGIALVLAYIDSHNSAGGYIVTTPVNVIDEWEIEE